MKDPAEVASNESNSIAVGKGKGRSAPENAKTPPSTKKAEHFIVVYICRIVVQLESTSSTRISCKYTQYYKCQK